jgi:hypothetical protein
MDRLAIAGSHDLEIIRRRSIGKIEREIKPREAA